MSLPTILELVVAAALIIGGIVLYRRRGPEGQARTGSQTAVILMVIGLILAIHGSGLLEYRPSAAEIAAQDAPRPTP